MSQEEVDSVVAEFKIVSYTETSAKTGFNTKQLFINITKELLADHDKYLVNKPLSNSLYSRQSSMVKIVNNNLNSNDKEKVGDNINPSKSTCFC